MPAIADHGPIEIPDLYQDMTLRIGKRTEITDVTVSAYPDRGTFR